jgi:hypothetical protein
MPTPPPPCCACRPNGSPGRRTKTTALLSAVQSGLVSKSTLGDMYFTVRDATSYTMMKL